MAAGASGGGRAWRRPAGAARLLAALALLAAGLLACGGGEGAGLVRGLIVEVVDRPAATDAGPAEIETLRLRDADGRLWTFSAEGPLDKDGAHLRLHQLLGESILALYERRNGRLVITALRD